jgi:hypothetical protein
MSVSSPMMILCGQAAAAPVGQRIAARQITLKNARIPFIE